MKKRKAPPGSEALPAKAARHDGLPKDVDSADKIMKQPTAGNPPRLNRSEHIHKISGKARDDEKVAMIASMSDAEQLARSNALTCQIILVVKKHKFKLDIDSPAGLSERKRHDIARLCELALEPGMQKNEYRVIKTPVWYQDLREVATAFQATNQARVKYEEEFNDLTETALVGVEIVKVGLDAKNSASPEAMKQVDANVEKAKAALAEAKRSWDAAMQTKLKCEREERFLVESALDIAYINLLLQGLMPTSRNADASESESDDKENQDPKTGQPEIRVEEEGSKLKGRDATTTNQEHQKSNILSNLQRNARDAVRRTRDQRSEASRAFHRVRDEYKVKLAEFLQSSKRGGVSGTRTEFDGRYFLARGRANRRYRMAEEEFEATVREAKSVGAIEGFEGKALEVEEMEEIDEGERDDEPRGGDEGVGQGSFDLDAYLANLQREGIEAWRRDPAQREIASEGGWEDMLSLPGQKTESLAGLSGCSLEWATGEDRVAIDEWEAHRQKLRAMEWPGLDSSS